MAFFLQYSTVHITSEEHLIHGTKKGGSFDETALIRHNDMKLPPVRRRESTIKTEK